MFSVVDLLRARTCCKQWYSRELPCCCVFTPYTFLSAASSYNIWRCCFGIRKAFQSVYRSL